MILCLKTGSPKRKNTIKSVWNTIIIATILYLNLWRNIGFFFLSQSFRKTPCDEECHSRHSFPNSFVVSVTAVSNPIPDLDFKIPPVLRLGVFEILMVDGNHPNIRTFIENYDRIAEKYGKDF